jgi:pyruvate dehydrogenase E2 component (dihydrolipoamide acetyltransferase)
VLEFRLPDVGEGLEEAEVVRWLVKEGESVGRDQALVEIQTDKALVEIPSPEAGTVLRLAAVEGAIVRVGELLFVLDGAQGESAASVPAPRGEKTPAEASTETDTAAPASPTASASPGAKRRVRASPAVRRLAVELGVDLSSAEGSGPGGRVVAEDVRRLAAAASSPAPVLRATEPPRSAAVDVGQLGQAPPGVMPLRGIRRVTAETMARSWAQIPHIHSNDEIDASELMACRRRLRTKGGPGAERLTMSVFFVLAVARALRRYPLVNASIDVEAGEIRVHAEVHVGLAVSTPAGLMVPVVRSADELALPALAAEIDRLRRAAIDRSVRPDELRGGTFTVTNFGSLGGRFAAPIIVPPEAGIMGFGAIRERPLVVDGEVVARPVLPVSFGADHRLIDGDLSVAFQECVKDLLRHPMDLLVDPRHLHFGD